MTLLSIIQDAADELSLIRPDSVIGNTDSEVQKLLRYANKCGVKLMRAYPWQALRTEQSFTALGQEEQTSIIPTDFDRFVAETFWNRTVVCLVAGPVSAVEWQSLKASSYALTARPKFTRRGNSVLYIPTPTAGDSLAFEYVSRNWCQSSGGTGQAAWAADDDTGVLDEELLTLGTIYEYAAGEDLPAVPALMAYRDAFDRLTGNEEASAGVLLAADIFGGGRHFSGEPTVSSLIL